MEELTRILRVSDQMATGYAVLRDQYALRARVLDFFILAVSAWLLAMVFVEPSIGKSLSPFHIPSEIWIGLLSIFVFVLAIVQSRVDWKAKSDAYQRALISLSEVVLDGRQLFAATPTPTLAEANPLITKYYVLVRFIEPIPENRFLEVKQKHKLKVAISKLLDDKPGASLHLLRLQIWIRDNLRS